MNWDDLRIFLAVAREGSLKSAAKQLKVQHSTVSRRMRSFEGDLGVRLFDRKRGGTTMTDAGLELEAIARRMERDILELDTRVSDQDDQVAGLLRVSTADAMAVTFLMPIFVDFSREYPGVDLRISVSNDYVRLGEREADVAIRASNSPPETLIGQRIARLAFAVYGAEAYLDDLGPDETPCWISAEGGMPHQVWIGQQTAEAHTSMVVDEAVLTHAALREGAGVALMPCFQGDPDPALKRFRPPDPATEIDLWLLVHKDLRRTKRVRVFRDYVATRVSRIRDLLEGRAP